MRVRSDEVTREPSQPCRKAHQSFYQSLPCCPSRLPFSSALSANPSQPWAAGPGRGETRDHLLSLSTGLKAFRQQLRKNARTKGFLGLNKIKGLARQVCQPSSSRATRGGLSAFQLPTQNPGVLSSGASSREGRSLLEEVLHQQRYAHSASPLWPGEHPVLWGFLSSLVS